MNSRSSASAAHPTSDNPIHNAIAERPLLKIGQPAELVPVVRPVDREAFRSAGPEPHNRHVERWIPGTSSRPVQHAGDPFSVREQVVRPIVAWTSRRSSGHASTARRTARPRASGTEALLQRQRLINTDHNQLRHDGNGAFLQRSPRTRHRRVRRPHNLQNLERRWKDPPHRLASKTLSRWLHRQALADAEGRSLCQPAQSRRPAGIGPRMS